MRLVSTTLAGPNTAATIGRALESVAPWVDLCLVIDTSPGGSADVQRAAEAAVGSKLRVTPWEWQNDFGEARNVALDVARGHGATWALWVDTDEWIEPNGEDVRAKIESTDAPAVLMASEENGYWQPRAIRLPCSARWDGRTHEAIMLDGPRFEKAVFAEMPKTAEQLRAKFERDAAILRGVVQERPNEARWWLYLGSSLHGLGRDDEAIEAFLKGAKIDPWPEQAAWTCFRAAVLLTDRGDHDRAVELCALGLVRHAGFSELPWIAGLASLRAKRFDQAIYWSRLAVVHGVHGHPMALERRMGFRCEKGLGPGPYEVLEEAMKGITS